MIEASSANDEVWVMSGTYKPNSYPAGSGGISPRDFAFIMKDKVKVYGGFIGTETALSQRTRSIMLTNLRLPHNHQPTKPQRTRSIMLTNPKRFEWRCGRSQG